MSLTRARTPHASITFHMTKHPVFFQERNLQRQPSSRAVLIFPASKCYRQSNLVGLCAHCVLLSDYLSITSYHNAWPSRLQTAKCRSQRRDLSLSPTSTLPAAEIVSAAVEDVLSRSPGPAGRSAFHGARIRPNPTWLVMMERII